MEITKRFRRICKAAYILSLAPNPLWAEANNANINAIIPTQYRSIDLRSSPSAELNLYGAEYKSGCFVSRANVLSTNLIYDKGILLSYNSLIQFPLVFAANFSAYPTNRDMHLIAMLNLLNGEAGIMIDDIEIGFRNSFNLYFTRRVYHQSGLYIGYGKRNNISISAFELDRLNASYPKLGISISFQRRIDKTLFR